MPTLVQVTVFLAAALICVPICNKLGLAAVIGYLLAGVLLGPYGFNVISDTEQILHFSEFGIVLFMFLVGMELRPTRLWAMRRAIFAFGGLQMLVTGAAFTLLGHYVFNLSWIISWVIGTSLSLSSTAFVLQLLSERNQLNTTFGRKAFSVLLFQDLAVIPIMAMISILSTLHGSQGKPLNYEHILTVLLVLVLFIVASRLLIRPFLRLIASSNSGELFTAAALFLVVGVATLMNSLHISMSLGAFMAGVLLADSEYRHELEASIQPFKGLLLGLFFMAVGMNAPLDLFKSMPATIVGGTLLFMAIKFFIILGLGRLFRMTWENSVRLGASLAQGGEFAFVMFTLATQKHILGTPQADPYILMVILSMTLTPIVFWIVDHVYDVWLEAKTDHENDEMPHAPRPVIIVGFGRMGQIIGRILRMRNIEFTAIERSIHHVDFVRKYGSEVYYGDASNPELLKAAGIQNARLIVLCSSHVDQSVKIAEYVRRVYPEVAIVARARHRRDVYRLREAGVQTIWRETYYSALGMAEDSLERLGMPRDEVRETIRIFDEHDQRLLRLQQDIHRDENKLIELVKQADLDLENIFEDDRNIQQDGKHKPSSVAAD